MRGGSGRSVGVLVVDGEGVAVDVVGDIDGHVLRTHRTRHDGKVRSIAGDGGRGDAVVDVVVDALGMRGGSGRSVGVLVVDGQRVAVEREVGYVRCRFGDEEGERCIGADHFAVLGPVGEGVAFVGSD